MREHAPTMAVINGLTIVECRACGWTAQGPDEEEMLALADAHEVENRIADEDQ